MYTTHTCLSVADTAVLHSISLSESAIDDLQLGAPWLPPTIVTLLVSILCWDDSGE